MEQQSDDSLDEEVVFASIPRKITLFRCVMEKKLGIDWEHSVQSSENLAESMQTDNARDGYREVMTES